VQVLAQQEGIRIVLDEGSGKVLGAAEQVKIERRGPV